jgi:hypothetical protein
MEMFLMILGVSVFIFGLGVATVRFQPSMRSDSSDSALETERTRVNAVAPTLVSSEHAAAVKPVALPRQIPIELLLLQIENHVRLEQAAAESFLEFPTHALLYSKTTSPFVN